MGRKKKEVSCTQRNAELLNSFSAQIRDYGVTKFVTLVDVDRVTLYNWMEGKPVEVESERAILEALQTLGASLVKLGVTIQATVAKTTVNYA